MGNNGYITFHTSSDAQAKARLVRQDSWYLDTFRNTPLPVITYAFTMHIREWSRIVESCVA